MSVSICKGIARRDVNEVLSAVTAVGYYVHDRFSTVCSFNRVGVIQVKLDSPCNGGAKPGMEYAVIFTDMGPATGELSSPSAFFPFIHSFWAECSGGSLVTCKTGPEPYTSAPEGYRSPGNFAESANRYTFILFEAPAGTRLSMGGFAGAALAEKLAEAKAALVAGDQAKSFQALGFLVHFDFAQFGVENPSYKAVRWNYMMVNHRK